MRRLKHASFSQSGPPAEWERRFAAIVREHGPLGPPSIDRFELPLPSSPLSPPPVPPSPMPPPSYPSAGGEFGATPAGGWAASWAAQIATADAVSTEPAGSPPLSFDGFASVAARETAPGKERVSAFARLKRRLLKAGSRASRPPTPRGVPREAERVGPPAGAPGRGSRDKPPGPAVPDFPRRPAGGEAGTRQIARRDSVLPREGARPGAAAWLSRADGPLRTTADLPVVGPALMATAIIVGCGFSAAYLTQRIGLEFDPVVRSVARSLAPVPVPAVAGAPLSGPSVPPTVKPSPVVPPDAVPSPPAPLALAPPPISFATSPHKAPEVDLVAMAGSPASRPVPAVAPRPRPPVADRRTGGPVVAAAVAVPSEAAAPVRPAVTMPPAASVAQAAPLLPFPLQAVSARGAETELPAPGRLLGWSGESATPLVAPLVPRSVFAAEAITAQTIDAVPQGLLPSDARVEDGARAASVPPAAAVPAAQVAASSLVADIQRALHRSGFDPGPIDGIAGPRTQAAVRAFQRRVGERPNGVLDTALLQELKRTPATDYADGMPAPARGRDPLAGLVRALADLFGLPAEGDFDGSIASAGDQQRVNGASRRDGDGRAGE